jgi:hypothetical protein
MKKLILLLVIVQAIFGTIFISERDFLNLNLASLDTNIKECFKQNFKPKLNLKFLDKYFEYPKICKKSVLDKCSVRLISKDNSANIAIFFIKSEKSLKEQFEKLKKLVSKSKFKLGFNKFAKNWYVISALSKNGIITYQKAYKQNDILVFYILNYPKSKAKEYDKIIKYLNANFKPNTSNLIKPSQIKGGKNCDISYRTCTVECFDKPNEDACLKYCERELDRCYKKGKYKNIHPKY